MRAPDTPDAPVLDAAAAAARAPAWVRRLHRFNERLLFDLLGGPRPWKLSWIIDAQKGGSLPVLALLMWWYAARSPGATSPAAWTYLALHGGYGLCWLLKDLAFPDPAWQRRATVASGLVTAAGLAAYWSFGWLVISGTSSQRYPLPEAAWLALCTLLCLAGCALMLAADAQKYFTLRARPGLVTDGLHRWVRHPNYLGEMLVYGALALVAWHWWPAVVLAYIWGTVFLANMAMKEARLSRHPEWAAYRGRTWWLLPFVL